MRSAPLGRLPRARSVLVLVLAFAATGWLSDTQAQRRGGSGLTFSPSPLTETLESGTSGVETVTITNNAGIDVDFDFTQYSAVRLAAPHSSLPHLEIGKGERDPRIGDTARGSGGPDAFGYQWIDSNEPSGPVYSFVDISGTGTALVLSDDAGETVTLPFTFSFYGVDKTEVTIGSNGYLTFGIDGTDFSNDAIPDAIDPNDYIAPFWDDLDPGDGVGTVYYQDMGDGRFIAQWDGVPDFPGDDPASGLNTFQVILYQNGRMLFQYEDMNGDLLGSTIGLENADATDGLQVAFNEAYVENGLAVLLQARPAFVTDVSPATGTIAPGGSVEVDVSFDATGLIADTYDGTLLIETDLTTDPSSFELPVELTVTGSPVILIDPASVDFGDVIVGASADAMVTISNTGTDDLEITSIASDNADFTLSSAGGVTVEPSQSFDLGVAFSPSTEGAIAGTLTLTTNKGSGTQTIAVSGNGTPPPIASVDVTELDGEAAQDESDTDAFTLTNDGNGPLDFEITIGPSMTLRPSSTSPSAETVVRGRDEATVRLAAPEQTEPNYEVVSRIGAGPGDILFTGSFVSGSPLGITQAPDGSVWAADLFSGVTEIFDADLNPTGTINHPTGTATTTGITYNDATGTIWWINADTSTLVEGNLDGTATGNTIALTLGAGGLPAGVSYHNATGWYFYVDIANDDIFAIDETGAVIAGYPVPQTSGDDGTGSFGNGLDALGDGLDVLFGASTGTQVTDVVATDLSGVNTGPITPVGQTTDTFINDVVRSRQEPNGVMYLVGNSTSTIYAVFPAERDDIGSFVSVTPESGTVDPNSSTSIDVLYDATNLDVGTYMATIIVNSNDPSTPSIEIPVTFEVTMGTANEGSGELPNSFALAQNFPNPFSGTTTIRYALPTATHVRLEVYDIVGRQIAVLVDAEQPAAFHEVNWNANALASGVYLVRMHAENFEQTMKLVVSR